MTEPSPPAIHINPLDGWVESAPSNASVDAAARAALATGPAEGAELSITFVSASSIRALNRDYHGADGATDVLAFGLGADPWLGDIYICPEVADAAAREMGLDSAEEILRLVIHGVLHLLGHDHPDGEARYASPMFRLQERLLAEVRGRA